VYGEGGIEPDVVVEPQTLAPFIQYLLSRNAFFDFAVEKAGALHVESREWQAPPQLMDQFSQWLIDQELASREEIDEGFAEAENRETAQRYVVAEIFNSVFGIEARYQVLAAGDLQIQRALELFDQAADLLARHRKLIETPVSAPSTSLGLS
jgi:hypothetical protein